MIKIVFVLIAWNSVGSARGDYFSRAAMLSEHETAAACEQALLIEAPIRAGIALSCMPASVIPKPYDPTTRKTTRSGGVTCIGDDRFCARLP